MLSVDKILIYYISYKNRWVATGFDPGIYALQHLSSSINQMRYSATLIKTWNHFLFLFLIDFWSGAKFLQYVHKVVFLLPAIGRTLNFFRLCFGLRYFARWVVYDFTLIWSHKNNLFNNNISWWTSLKSNF